MVTKSKHLYDRMNILTFELKGNRSVTYGESSILYLILVFKYLCLDLSFFINKKYNLSSNY